MWSFVVFFFFLHDNFELMKIADMNQSPPKKKICRFLQAGHSDFGMVLEPAHPILKKRAAFGQRIGVADDS